MPPTVVEPEITALPVHPRQHAAAGCGCGGHGHSGSCSTGHKGLGLTHKFRRVHSLAGLAFGVFLVVHLLIASTAHSPAKFGQVGAFLHKLAQRTPGLEIGLVLTPLLFLLGSGAYLLGKSGLRYGIKKCHRGSQLQFFLQRASAVGVLSFLGLHLSTFGRWAIWPAFKPDHAFSSTLAGVRMFWSARSPSHPLNIAVLMLYLVGILAVTYHLSNGLWTAAIEWNVMQSAGRKWSWGRTCAAVGIVIGCIGVFAWSAFVRG